MSKTTVDVPAELEALIEAIEQGRDNEGELTNGFLEELFQGRSLSHLMLLLNHENEEVVRAGAWIASELGDKASPVRDRIYELLNHGSKRVRFWATEAAYLCTTTDDARILARAAQMSADEDGAVRWKALSCLARTSIEKLRAALSYLEENEGDERQVAGLRLLLSREEQDLHTLESIIQGTDGVMRGYGAVAAVRMRSKTIRMIEVAQHSDDLVVRRFADSMMRLHLAGALRVRG